MARNHTATNEFTDTWKNKVGNIADIYSDLSVLKTAGDEARQLISNNFDLKDEKHKALRREIAELYRKL